MKIVDTKQYLESLYGKFLTIWIDGGALFSIDKFSSYKIINSVGTIEKKYEKFVSDSNSCICTLVIIDIFCIWVVVKISYLSH